MRIDTDMTRTILSTACALLVGCAADDVTEPVCGEVSNSHLVAKQVKAGPNLDGVADDAQWDCASVLEVKVAANSVYTPEGSPDGLSYPGLAETTVQLRAVHTDTELFMVATWADPTHSLARYPWEKQADGSWTQWKNRDSSGHENTWYEDKFAVQWGMGGDTFAAQGCYSGCHAAVDNANPGKKYNPPGELTDMWHWKAVRTEPNGQLDDKHVSFVDSGDCKGDNCRLGDEKTGGGYKDNTFDKFADACSGDPDGSLQVPCFMGPAGQETVGDDRYWILVDQMLPFEDAFDAGDQIAGMCTEPFEGSRGDVWTSARYDDGTWTLEIRRALDTGHDDDVQFTDLAREYPFGVAVFDNTQINHAAHAGPLTLGFER